MRYRLIITDKQTGEYPETEIIALREGWARHLSNCDITGFALDEEGHLLLIDGCDNIAYCPEDRFDVKVKQGPS